MSRHRKFKPGRIIENFDDLAHCINAGCWFYWGQLTRPEPPTILANQHFRTLMILLRNRRLRIAETITPTSEPAA